MSPLLPWQPLALKPVTFDLSPQPTFLQLLNPGGMLCCYGTWGLAAAACWCCLVHHHQPVNRHQGASSGLVAEESWRAILRHTGSFDSTSVVSFSLLTDVEMVSKGKADVCVLLETCQRQAYLCVLDCFCRNGLDSTKCRQCLFTLTPKTKSALYRL